jgi:hypothetical protein
MIEPSKGGPHVRLDGMLSDHADIGRWAAPAGLIASDEVASAASHQVRDALGWVETHRDDKPDTIGRMVPVGRYPEHWAGDSRD